MIEIKFFFSDWHEVSKERVQKFIKIVLSGMTMRGGQNAKNKYINEHFLKGGTIVKELVYIEKEV